MKGSLRSVLLLVLLCCSPLPVLAAAVDRLLVAFESGVAPADVIREFTPPPGVAVTLGPGPGRAFVLQLSPPLDAGAARQLAARLAEVAGVRYAEVPPRFQPHFVPSDARYGSQWNLWDSYGIRAPEAWDIERGDPDLVIAALDTGILAHEDLDASRVLPGFDFISDPVSAGDGDGRDPDPTDPGDGRLEGDCPGEAPSNSSWHGLHIVGVLLATADNALGIAGINHRSRLLPVRVLGKCGGDFVDVAFAMLWAAGLEVTGVPDNPNPARVLNLSFGGPGACTPAVQDIVDQVLATGAVIVAAAGNENGADVADSVPAGCAGVITVAATTRSGGLAPYSNKGPGVALSAPAGGSGEGVLSLSNTGALLPDADGYAAY
ncbi:MAG TPA: peptidase S8, partial [Thiotrichales bacterium]|nr:peptidase S8 [Thiotrichales bacterium]